ncbi:hypothetical protein PYH37_000934 [Sinorhizobium numidicum]|uniref:Uncharacterized protein n=1 Tax=Sinorhizobium numidicum TaxID=680248 RepID=A0ABY8CS90_9HYPH|nr:hypothetical protein [Sinorhizobium numidicum]WEX75514.1 hypothetical protein PYH37_000934 [Sinorhizobium numidicum]WEX81511.1 hypothetical protein PYH38_000935 [Sinorhizobium numidicum]
MYDLHDAETMRNIDRIGQTMLQNVVELALEDGYSHGTITAGLIKQAYTIIRLTLPIDPAERKELFLKLAADMADRSGHAAARIAPVRFRASETPGRST